LLSARPGIDCRRDVWLIKSRLGNGIHPRRSLVKHSTLAALTVFALAGALAGCSERNPPTGPSVDVATLSPASFIGDRPYAWNFTCHGGFVLLAPWAWPQGGGAIRRRRLHCCGDWS